MGPWIYPRNTRQRYVSSASLTYASHRPVQLANVLHAELPKEFQYMIHPVNHPVTRHVRRDVTVILEGNELNTLCSGQDTSLGLAHLNPKPGVIGEPYGGTRARQEADGQVLGGHGVYWWSMMRRVVNATASFSAFSASDNIHPLISDSVTIISSYHGNLPICQGRARFSCVTTFKSHMQNFLRIVELRTP